MYSPSKCQTIHERTVYWTTPTDNPEYGGALGQYPCKELWHSHFQIASFQEKGKERTSADEVMKAH